MRVRTIFTLLGIGVAVMGASFGLSRRSRAQATSQASWALPHGLKVKDGGPRTYEFTVVYSTGNGRGEIIQRQRLTAEYVRGLPGGEVLWKNVTEATADGATAAFGPAEKRGFMEGFRYRNDLTATLAPDFFKGFPPTAVRERNLVWDTGMIEMFGQNYFDRLVLNQSYRVISNGSTTMPGVGTFLNRDVVLEWIGNSRRRGQNCAVIQYHAYFNPLALEVGGMKLRGRSDYWGTIWVSQATKQIEYGTIYESVVGEMQAPGQAAAQPVNVFRAGRLEATGKE